MPGLMREVLLETLWVSRFLFRGVVESVQRNTGWAFLALLLSAALWVIVTGEQNPPKMDVFPNPIPVEAVNIPPDLGVLGDVQFVRVRISAQPEAWARITAGTFRASADLSSARPGLQEVGVRVASSDAQVRVLEVVPPQIPLTVEVLASRQLPVKVNLVGTAPLGVSIGEPTPSLKEVMARGPAPLVGRVESAAVDIPLEGLRVAVNSQSFRLVPRNAAGSRIEGITLEPATVEVTLPVEQVIYYRSLPLLPSLQGQVSEGYWVSALRVDPPAVTVAGPREALEPLSFLTTQPLDVNRLDRDTVRTAVVALPLGLSLIEPRSGSSTVFIYVSPVQGTQALSVAPTFTGLSPGLKAASDSVALVLSGPLPRLRQLKPADVAVTLDLQGLVPGSYTLAPKVAIPSGLEVAQPPNPASVTISRE